MSDDIEPVSRAAGVRGWLAFLAIVGALIAIVFAYIIRGALSNGYSDSGKHSQTLPVVQLIIAVCGLIPAGAVAATLVSWRPRWFTAWLMVAVATYIAWGVVNSAAVHSG